jgi:hypothetical protein
MTAMENSQIGYVLVALSPARQRIESVFRDDRKVVLALFCVQRRQYSPSKVIEIAAWTKLTHRHVIQ